MSVFISKQLMIPSFGKALSDYAIGESVFVNVNGAPKEFIVVHQGLPSTVYDSSCDGTWLLMKDAYESRAIDSSNHDYENSDIHSYLNNTFINLLDADIKSAIKQVKIPYRKGSGNSTTVTSGSNGLAAKIFLPSYTEVGFSGDTYAAVEGAVFSYFYGAENSKRIANLNGSATIWWLRTPNAYSTDQTFRVLSWGSGGGHLVTNLHGIRPALILPYDTPFNPETNEVIT